MTHIATSCTVFLAIFLGACQSLPLEQRPSDPDTSGQSPRRTRPAYSLLASVNSSDLASIRLAIRVSDCDEPDESGKPGEPPKPGSPHQLKALKCPSPA